MNYVEQQQKWTLEVLLTEWVSSHCKWMHQISNFAWDFVCLFAFRIEGKVCLFFLFKPAKIFKQPFIRANQTIISTIDIWYFLCEKMRCDCLRLAAFADGLSVALEMGYIHWGNDKFLFSDLKLLTYHKGYISVIFSKLVKGWFFLTLRYTGNEIFTILYKKFKTNKQRNHSCFDSKIHLWR